MGQTIDFETISFVGPWIGLWVGLVCGAIALTLVLVAVVRVRRHRAHAVRDGRNQDPNLLHDVTLQRRVGYGFAAVAVVGAAAGAVLYVQDRAAFEHNVRAKYPQVVELEDVQQTGTSYTADLRWADGTAVQDELIVVEPDGEPFLGEDILGEPGLGGR